MTAQSATSGTRTRTTSGSVSMVFIVRASSTPARDVAVTIRSDSSTRACMRRRPMRAATAAASAAMSMKTVAITKTGLFHVAAAVDPDCLAGDEVALEERED